jgi:hypothetical protein
MKKRSWLLILLLMVAILFASISVVAAKPDSPGAIQCDLNITLDDYDDGTYWNGRVDGDECEIAGRIRFFAVREEYACPGDTIHFVETFIIEPDSGGSIEGKNWGVWNLNTGQFRSHGWVMASEEYPDLVGNQYHEMGTTSTTDLSERPIYATDGNMKLVPGDRPLDSIPATVPQNPCFPST